MTSRTNAPVTGDTDRYRRMEREWQDSVGYALLDKPYERPGSAAVFERQFDRLISLLDGAANGVVIEIGCGKGHFLERLSTSRVAPRTLVGLDLSRAVPQLAREGTARGPSRRRAASVP